jgi:hypothetical protein
MDERRRVQHFYRCRQRDQLFAIGGIETTSEQGEGRPEPFAAAAQQVLQNRRQLGVVSVYWFEQPLLDPFEIV